MLASDVNNPEFMGAHHPDAGLSVDFFWHEEVDSWATREKSIAAQRHIEVKLPKAPFVRIMVPGDKTTEWVGAVTEPIKRRFGVKWMAWQINEGLIDGGGEVPGWQLKEWTELSQDQVRELLHLRFQTVEQLAGASDKQIQGVGMGGLELREKAKVALRNKMGAETKAAIETRDAEIAELRASQKAMQEQMAKLMESLGEKSPKGK